MARLAEQIPGDSDFATPMGRLGRAQEIAAGALFLASDQSSYLTGSDLILDGGADI